MEVQAMSRSPSTQSADPRQVYRNPHGTVQQRAPSRPSEQVPSDQRRRIAMLAPPWIPVPPPGYGGIEFVVALLTDALVDRGHEVELFCTPGSSSKAKVHPLLEAP